MLRTGRSAEADAGRAMKAASACASADAYRESRAQWRNAYQPTQRQRAYDAAST